MRGARAKSGEGKLRCAERRNATSSASGRGLQRHKAMSLFLKIFLWFWGAMAILALALSGIQVTTRDDLVIAPKSNLMIDALKTYGLTAVETYETGGPDALNRYLQTIERKKKVQVFLFDPNGLEIGNPPGVTAPSDVRYLADKTARLQVGDFQLSTFRVMAALPVGSSRSSRYFVFCGAVSRNQLAATRTDSSTRLLQLLVIGLVTGMFCYGLARFLAAPVGKIRVAAQRLAQGDLSARVEPNRFPRGQDELTRLARDFDRMASRLEGLVVAQNRLLGDVSHELRTPLTRLNLALELARRGDEIKREAALNRIERESQRLDELIRELLTLSRLENGLPASKLNAPLDLAELAHEIAADADFEARGAGRGVRVKYLGAAEHVMTRGDGELLRRAIENLTRNALRHTSNHSQVTIELRAHHSELVLTVKDRGPGVPPEELEAIFRPFYRVEGARERAESDRGTGLGLAIAERAVRAHNGQISAQNRDDGGLCVSIELPQMKEHGRHSGN